jgi:tetratricopeptide (TPR) repeat protein
MGYMTEMIAKSIKNMSEDICDRLDKLQNVMENPRRSTVLELFLSSKKRIDAGFYRAALKDLNEAIEKDETDYMLHYLKGTTYFFGKSDFPDDNVADTDEAISALTKAAYYIKPYIEKNNEDRLIAAGIFRCMGFAKDNKYRELTASGQEAKAQLMIGEAQTAFTEWGEYAE